MWLLLVLGADALDVPVLDGGPGVELFTIQARGGRAEKPTPGSDGTTH